MPNSGDALIDWMEANGVEVTRENYIDAAFGNTPPDPWTADDEAELPEELQDWDLFKEIDGDLIYMEKKPPPEAK